MANENELLLIPRLEKLVVDGTKLKSDLISLQRNINKDSPLTLSLSADINQSVGRLTADLKKIKPQLDNVLKISIGADALTATKTTTQTSTKSTGTKTLTDEAIQIQKVNQEYNQLISTLKKINNLDLKIVKLDVEKDSAQIAELSRQLEGVKEKYATLYSGVMEDPLAKQLLSQKQSILFENEREKGVNAVNAALAHQKDVVEKIKQMQNQKSDSTQNKEFIDAQKTEDGIRVLQSRIDNLKTSSSKILGNPEIMARIKEIEDGLKNIGNDPAKLTRLNKDFQVLSNNIGEAGLRTQSWGDKIKSTFDRLSAYMVNVAVFGTITKGVRDAVQAVKDIDLAMTELKKVTNETDATYTKFLDNAAERAQRLGASISDVVTATADFARLGYSIPQAEQLSDAAIIYKHVGDGIKDISEASESIISTMKAFDVQAENSMSIVDKFNITGKYVARIA